MEGSKNIGHVASRGCFEKKLKLISAGFNRIPLFRVDRHAVVLENGKLLGKVHETTRPIDPEQKEVNERRLVLPCLVVGKSAVLATGSGSRSKESENQRSKWTRP